MKTMLKTTMVAVAFATVALAGPPGGKMRGEGMNPEHRAERMEAMQQRMHLAAVVGIAEALDLTESEALKMSEKMKVFEARRLPLRQGMHESMKTLKAAADGDAASQAQVDGAIQKLLDGRAQMAQLDREMFNALAQGQPPAKRAKLALFMAHFGQQMQKFKGKGGKGRRHQGGGE